MKEDTREQVVTVIGIDLAKHSFHAHGVNARGERVLSKKL